MDTLNVSVTNLVLISKRNLKPYLVLSVETNTILEWCIFAVTCQAIDVFGIVTNILNIICFTKQGFKDPINVSLVGLAISDLGCLITLVWTNICMTPAFSASDLPFDAYEFQYITSSWPHATFTRITSWITALITLERCLCITVPLKVKEFVTPKRVIIIIIVVYVLLTSSVVPEFIVNRLGLKYFEQKNKTLIGLVYTEDREAVERISFPVNNIGVPAVAFIIISICTIVLVIQLHQSTAWRKKTAILAQVDNITIRNKNVSKMVVTISSLFVVCFIPVCIIFLGMSLDSEFTVGGAYTRILSILVGVGFILESINSSVNIFIYYHMSSKYRSVFRQLMCKIVDL